MAPREPKAKPKLAPRKSKAKPKLPVFESEEDLEGGEIEGDLEDIAAATAGETLSVFRPGYGEYEISIERVLKETLPEAFDKVERAPLSEASIKEIRPGAKGAYLLFYDSQMVYAGKTDTRHGFRDRLFRHSRSVQQRVNLEPQRMFYKALRILVFSAFDVEAILITEMRRLSADNLLWNDSGFGSNDPGRKRDDGEPARFDQDFPIDIDLPLPRIVRDTITVRELLKAASKGSDL